MPKRELWRLRGPILTLAVGLVLFTVVGGVSGDSSIVTKLHTCQQQAEGRHDLRRYHPIHQQVLAEVTQRYNQRTQQPRQHHRVQRCICRPHDAPGEARIPSYSGARLWIHHSARQG